LQRDSARSTPITDRTFQGYRGPTAGPGRENYLAVISSVNCSASVCRHVARRIEQSGLLRQYPNVDGILPIVHGAGCGVQYAGPYHQLLSRTLGGMAKHPNVGGYLLIGLGCETSTIGFLIERERLVQIDGTGAGHSVRRPIALSMQDLGGTQKTIDAAIAHLAEMLPRVDDVPREPCRPPRSFSAPTAAARMETRA